MNGASEIPTEIQKLKHTEIRKIFPEPTLIEIPGQSDETVFLSTLLHGNEPASFGVLQLLQKHLESGHKPKRSLMIFVGNVEAAEQNKRYLPHQNDYNRVWKEGDTAEHKLMKQVKDLAAKRKLFASIDVHNNTGTNPFYACINKKSMDHLKLASLFGNQIVFFENPNNVQSMAFSELCPSMTLECGRPENPDGPKKAFELLLDLIQIDRVPEHVADERDLQVYETVGKIDMDVTTPVKFAQEFEHWNFKSLPEGFPFATSENEKALEILNEKGEFITDNYLRHESGTFYLRQQMIPAMLTSNMEVVKQDCLGYLMKPLDWRKFNS